jgi:hypothetical protein
MNENFVRMIFTEEQEANFIKTFAGAVASTIDSHLNESEDGIIFESYTTNEGHYVYEVALNSELEDNVAEEMANTIAKAIPGDYEIEVSGGDDSSR